MENSCKVIAAPGQLTAPNGNSLHFHLPIKEKAAKVLINDKKLTKLTCSFHLICYSLSKVTC